MYCVILTVADPDLELMGGGGGGGFFESVHPKKILSRRVIFYQNKVGGPGPPGPLP